MYDKQSLVLDSIEMPIASVHYYLSMTKNFMEKVNKDQIKLKHLFYALLTVFATRWLVEQNTMKPTDFEELLAITSIPIIEKVQLLRQIKSTQGESYLNPEDTNVCTYLVKTHKSNVQDAAKLPSNMPKVSDLLNGFSIKSINGY
jgi:uncharacterized protein